MYKMLWLVPALTKFGFARVWDSMSRAAMNGY